MRQWGRRLENPAQFDIARLRIVGEWGEASRYIGSRWEELGLELLQAGVPGLSPLATLAVCNDPELQTLLAATGSKNPDVVMVLPADDGLVLQPADFKWSLDVASYRQISAPVIDRLLDQVPRLAESLRALLRPEASDLPWRTRDGIFISPKTYLNQRFLTSSENERQEYPIEPAEVTFIPVEPFALYGPLPGWPTARELARLDGSGRGLGQIDTADRYYHLGAGLAGALAVAGTSIFDEATAIDPAKEIDRLREFLKTLSPPSTALAVDRLGVEMRHRRDLGRRLRDLSRSSLRFEDFTAQLTAAGLASAEDVESDLWRRFGDLYRSLVTSEEAEARKAGRELVARGANDVEALDQLERRRDSFERRRRLHVQTAIRELSQSRPSNSTSGC